MEVLGGHLNDPEGILQIRGGEPRLPPIGHVPLDRVDGIDVAHVFQDATVVVDRIVQAVLSEREMGDHPSLDRQRHRL